MSTPTYKHDCTQCVFLGTATAPGTPQVVDLYFCDQGGRPTVIARFSDDASDYQSGLGFTSLLFLKEAELRAKKLGLL